MKKPLIQLMKEAGLEWPAEANFAAQDKWCNAVYFMPANQRHQRKRIIYGHILRMIVTR